MSEVTAGIGEHITRPLPTLEELRPAYPYHSPFEDIDFSKRSEILPYNGRLGMVLDELEEQLQHPQENMKHILALHPPRVIRGIIEARSQGLISEDQEDVLVSKAVRLALDIYQNLGPTAAKTHAFQEYLYAISRNLLSVPVIQKDDSTTWEALRPDRSKATAQRLLSRTNGGDILFIAFAHGGVAAGLDVFSHYTAMSGNEDSDFLPIRFSRYKEKENLALSEQKKEKISKEIASGKSLVLFDEDTASGRTMRLAGEYFSTFIQKDKIRKETNYTVYE